MQQYNLIWVPLTTVNLGVTSNCVTCCILQPSRGWQWPCQLQGLWMALQTEEAVDSPGNSTRKSEAALRKTCQVLSTGPWLKLWDRYCKTNQGRFCTNKPYPPFPFLHFQHPEEHEFQASCAPCSWGKDEDTFWSAQILLPSKQHLAETDTPNSSKVTKTSHITIHTGFAGAIISTFILQRFTAISQKQTAFTILSFAIRKLLASGLILWATFV